jgi:hypothetical protein
MHGRLLEMIVLLIAVVVKAGKYGQSLAKTRPATRFFPLNAAAPHDLEITSSIAETFARRRLAFIGTYTVFKLLVPTRICTNYKRTTRVECRRVCFKSMHDDDVMIKPKISRGVCESSKPS